MAEMWIFLFYIAYAFTQGILLNRYFMKEKDLVVTIVVLMALFAPLVTVIAIGVGCHWLIKKGATPIK